VGEGDPGADARGVRRRAARAPYDALAAGRDRGIHGARVRVFRGSTVVRSVDDAGHALPEHAVRVVVVHDGVAWCAGVVVAADHLVAEDPARGIDDRGAAFPRPRQTGLRVHGVLGLSDVRAVPGHAVGQHG